LPAFPGEPKDWKRRYSNGYYHEMKLGGVRRPFEVLAGLGVVYLLVAYVLIPWVYRHARSRHPALVDAPRVVQTPVGIPGDPLNIVLVAAEERIVGAMLLAGWHPADPITLRSSLRIARSTIFHRPYEDAPVSTLLLWGRKQDLAFELEVGHDARERHHVRFWHSDTLDVEGRWAWFGAATFDRSVGFSHSTGQITHHISPEVDGERDKIIADLSGVGQVEDVDWIDSFQPKEEGRNGGGDRYHTDRRLAVVSLRAVSSPQLK
jgi:hypothetical protein